MFVHVEGLGWISRGALVEGGGQTSFTKSVTKMAAPRPMKAATKLGRA